MFQHFYSKDEAKPLANQPSSLSSSDSNTQYNTKTNKPVELLNESRKILFKSKKNGDKNAASTLKQQQHTWTFNLLVCCLSVGLYSLSFGYSISSLNSVTKIVQNFMLKNLFLFHHHNNSNSNSNGSTHDQTSATTTRLNMAWTLLNCVFVVGAMIGALNSKYLLDAMGRKAAILFHTLFTVLASCLVLVSYNARAPTLLYLSRFLFGVQGGMSCSMIPTYLNEIAPQNLRGQTGSIHQLMLTFGILIAQLFGFRQLLGKEHLWHVYLTLPVLASLIGFLTLFLFFPETPKQLYLRKGDAEAARHALQLLRNKLNVQDELEDICRLSKLRCSRELTLGEFFTHAEFKWPLVCSICIHMSQQLCGVNVVSYYSSILFEKARIPHEHIQYAILGTGLVKAFTTIVSMRLIDHVGRRPLLVYPIALIIFIFLALTFVFKHQTRSHLMPYVSLTLVFFFLTCFAIGLGPIPYLFTAEVFPQSAKSSAMATCVLMNWLSSLLITILFPILHELFDYYVFLVFSLMMCVSLGIIYTRVPETSHKCVEEILHIFNSRK